MPVLSFGWELAEDITSTPLLSGAPTTAEFRGKAFDFSPGAPARVVRLKQEEGWKSFSMDECAEIGNALIKQLGSRSRFELEGVAFDGQPRYFANFRMFLVSIDPAVMVIVPYVFPLKHSQLTIKNSYLAEEVNAAYLGLSKQRVSAVPNVLSVHLKNWLNILELSRQLPRPDGAIVISTLWHGEMSLQDIASDSRFAFVLVESTRFPGFSEVRPR